MSQLAQQIEYFDTPAPHFIIDNFLSTTLAQEFLNEAVRLQSKYQPATIGNDTIIDDCDECKRISKANQLIKRRNDVVYLDTENTILNQGMFEATHDQSFTSFMNSAPSVFPILTQCDKSEAILSRHGQCDFYGWHKDNDLGHLRKSRIVTLVYYFNVEPQKFEGGELTIAHPTIATRKIIIPKHNRAVLFSSNSLHCVNTVKLQSTDFRDGRFAINYWFGFT